MTPEKHLSFARNLFDNIPEKEPIAATRDRWGVMAGHASLSAAGNAETTAATLARIERRLNDLIVTVEASRLPWWRRLGGGW